MPVAESPEPDVRHPSTINCRWLPAYNLPLIRSFPLEGGTGGIWKAVAKLLPPERQRYQARLTSIDKERQIAKFEDGRQVGSAGGHCLYNSLSYSRTTQLHSVQLTLSCPCLSTPQVAYDALISTIPLDITLRWLGKHEWADGLQHSSSHIIGIGELWPLPP